MSITNPTRNRFNDANECRQDGLKLFQNGAQSFDVAKSLKFFHSPVVIYYAYERGYLYLSREFDTMETWAIPIAYIPMEELPDVKKLARSGIEDLFLSRFAEEYPHLINFERSGLESSVRGNHPENCETDAILDYLSKSRVWSPAFRGAYEIALGREPGKTIAKNLENDDEVMAYMTPENFASAIHFAQEINPLMLARVINLGCKKFGEDDVLNLFKASNGLYTGKYSVIYTSGILNSQLKEKIKPHLYSLGFGDSRFTSALKQAYIHGPQIDLSTGTVNVSQELCPSIEKVMEAHKEDGFKLTFGTPYLNILKEIVASSWNPSKESALELLQAVDSGLIEVKDLTISKEEDQVVWIN